MFVNFSNGWDDEYTDEAVSDNEVEDEDEDEGVGDEIEFGNSG